MDLILDICLLAIFSYALYRMAESYNITPWKWIIRYLGAYFASSFVLGAIIYYVYGDISKDLVTVEKLSKMFDPFILLYQFVLFFFFRNRIIRYVHILDEIDKKNNNNMPNPPTAPAKEQKDFSYFR